VLPSNGVASGKIEVGWEGIDLKCKDWIKKEELMGVFS